MIYGDDVIEQQLATDQMLLHFSNLAMHMNGELVLRKVNACVLMWAELQVRDMAQSVEKIRDRCSIFCTSCIPVCPEPGGQDAAVGLETSFAETRGVCRAREAAVWVGSRCTLRGMQTQLLVSMSVPCSPCPCPAEERLTLSLSPLQARSLLYQFHLLPRIPCSLHDLCKLCGTGMWDSGFIPAVECSGHHPQSESCPYGGLAEPAAPQPGSEGKRGLKTRDVFAFRK